MERRYSASSQIIPLAKPMLARPPSRPMRVATAPVRLRHRAVKTGAEGQAKPIVGSASLTVAMAVYNNGPFVGEAIDSILDQTVGDFRVPDRQ
ncbi:MAG: hypothetical protein H6917_14285 [Novosphingobium sp.]|nr:hypothetical protein [Novosphingobium sp.]